MPLRKRLKKFSQRLLSSTVTSNLFGTILFLYAKLIGFSTSCQQYKTDELYKTWDKDKAIILISWHGRALMPVYFWNKKYPMSALVSPHRDGRIIARLLRCFGIHTIDGSSNENANGAALALMRELQHNKSISIIPDGPKGPNMHLSRSALYFAQKTGKPIIGITYSIKGSKIAQKSWDRMMLPKPFSQGIIAATDAFYIPSDADADTLEKYRKQIEQELVQLTWDLDEEMQIPRIEPGSVAKQRYQKEKKAN